MARATRVIDSRARLPPGSSHLPSSSVIALSLLPPVVQLEERLHGAHDGREGFQEIEDHIQRRRLPIGGVARARTSLAIIKIPNTLSRCTLYYLTDYDNEKPPI